MPDTFAILKRLLKAVSDAERPEAQKIARPLAPPMSLRLVYAG
jgi:hypothetical protein